MGGYFRPARAGEIRRCLVAAGLIDPNSQSVMQHAIRGGQRAGHHDQAAAQDNAESSCDLVTNPASAMGKPATQESAKTTSGGSGRSTPPNDAPSHASCDQALTCR